jgi:F-type H+-transporting ATPase subunit alpha
MVLLVYGLSNVQYGELEFDNGLEAIVLNLEEDNVGVVLLGPSTGIKEGSIAKEHNIASLKVGEQMVGRVVTLGFPIDGKDQLVVTYEMPLERKAPELSSVNQLLNHYKQE